MMTMMITFFFRRRRRLSAGNPAPKTKGWRCRSVSLPRRWRKRDALRRRGTERAGFCDERIPPTRMDAGVGRDRERERAWCLFQLGTNLNSLARRFFPSRSLSPSTFLSLFLSLERFRTDRSLFFTLSLLLLNTRSEKCPCAKSKPRKRTRRANRKEVVCPTLEWGLWTEGRCAKRTGQIQCTILGILGTWSWRNRSIITGF